MINLISALSSLFQQHNIFQINKDRDISQGVISLSEQQCMDCTSAGGCGGGWPTVCYNWAKFHNSHYVATGNYPYEGRSGRPCRYNEHRSAMSGFSIKGNGYPHRGSAYRDHDATLLLADKNIGVLWAVISVSGSFGSYGDGVFNADDCNNGVNHAVVIVGYGKKGDLPFFKVRNSWGSWWGDGGYIRMIRGEGYENFNMCRLTQFVSYPIVEGADDGTSDDGIGPKPALECADGNQSGYRGTVNQTSSGKGCQRWDSQSPHKHSRTPENNPNAGLDENYCRNPDGEPKAWCYTVEDKRFEMCNVSDCSLHLWCQRDDKTLGRRWGNESFEDFNEAKRKCHTEWHCTGLVKRSNESEWWFSNGAYLIYELGTTTLRKGQCKLFEPRASDDITWCKIEDSYLATKTAGSWITEDFELAKYYCASAHDCGGVLKWDGKYQLRAGTKVKKSPSGETIWVKGQCPRLPTDNDYCEYKDRYIPGYTAGGYKGFATLEEAKKGCTDFGSGCYGITYEPASKSKHYTLRRYRWTAGSPSKEISWVKGVIC